MMKLNSQSGLSIAELVIAVALSVLVSFGAYRIYVSNLGGQKQIENANDIEFLRRHIQVSMDCLITRNAVPATCPTGTRIALYSGEDAVLVSDGTGGTDTLKGLAFLKAECGSRREIYRISYAWSTEDGCKGPVNGSCWKPLFSIPVGCP